MQVGQNFHHHNTECQKWVNFITMLNKSSESSNCIQKIWRNFPQAQNITWVDEQQAQHWRPPKPHAARLAGQDVRRYYLGLMWVHPESEETAPSPSPIPHSLSFAVLLRSLDSPLYPLLNPVCTQVLMLEWSSPPPTPFRTFASSLVVWKSQITNSSCCRSSNSLL